MRHFPELHAPAGRQVPTAFPFTRTTPHLAPLFEILVPLFNEGAGLGTTLRAIAGQSLTAWTVTVRDDGSRDGGPDLVRAFAAAIPERRVQLRTGAHRGPVRSAMTLLAEADPCASVAVLTWPGCRFGSDALARVEARLAASRGPALVLVRPGWRDRPATSLSFAEALGGRVPRPALLSANREALDLLRIASLWRGPVPCAVAWACRLVAGAGGDVTVLTLGGARAARRGAAARGVSAPALDALRAAGPLLAPAARRLVEETAAAMATVPSRRWRGAPVPWGVPRGA